MKIIWLPLLVGLFLLENPLFNMANNYFTTIQEAPPYAKWGQLAMTKTKAIYPDANIIDYLHVGRKSGTTYSTETFKLWLKRNNKEFGVFVYITFDNETEELIDITFKETTK